MATTVFPQTNDSVTESVWQGLNKSIAVGASRTQNGFDVTVNSGIIVDVAAGNAIVNGYHVSQSGTESVTLTDNTTNYLWLEPDGTLTDNTTGTNPGNALLLAEIVTASAAITSISKDFDINNGQFFLVRKTASENVASSTTLQDDDHLFCALEPGVYKFVMLLNTTYPAGGGLKVSLATTATNGYAFASVVFANASSSTPAGYEYLDDFGSTASYSTNAASQEPTIIDGVISLADAGTVKLQWAQAAASGTTTIYDSSALFLEKIS